MAVVKIGDKAPSFRLPSAQGADVGLEDYAGRPVAVWFTKGMACPFCRMQMTQLARGYPAIKAMGAEVLQITVSKPGQAKLYGRQFKLPYPYLCDPDWHVRQEWGMQTRSHGPAWYAARLVRGMRMQMPENDFGKFSPKPSELPALLTDDDMGFFVLDGRGVVRYAMSKSYSHEGGGPTTIPTNEEIVRELQRAQALAS